MLFFTVPELYIVVIVKELLKQTCLKATVQYFSQGTDANVVPMARRRVKGPKPPTYSKTVVKGKSLENSLRKVFKWLQDMELLHRSLKKNSVNGT